MLSIVSSFQILQNFKRSRYFRVSLGLVPTVEKNGTRIYNDKDKFAKFYNTQYNTTIYGQGNVGDIRFYVDHYIKDASFAVYTDDLQEFLFELDTLLVRDKGIEFYLGHILKTVEEVQEEQEVSEQSSPVDRSELLKNLNELANYLQVTKNNLTKIQIEKKQEHKKTIILKETEEQILNKLKKFENSKRFLNKDFSLSILAGQLDTNTKYLSEVINSHYHMNFNTYINKLRINYIVEKLKTDPNFIKYRISYLAENCGFTSHSAFATVFKNITGLTPVKFIEFLNNENKISEE
jgi:AraC-like DNA-binding protein